MAPDPPKWAYEDPERYGLTPCNEGLTCLRCNGSGEIQTNPSKIGDPQMAEDHPCPDCFGTGRPY